MSPACLRRWLPLALGSVTIANSGIPPTIVSTTTSTIRRDHDHDRRLAIRLLTARSLRRRKKTSRRGRARRNSGAGSVRSPQFGPFGAEPFQTPFDPTDRPIP